MNDRPRDAARRTGPALDATYQLLIWLIPRVDKFPRSQKLILGDRIETAALDVLDALIVATRRAPDGGAGLGPHGRPVPLQHAIVYPALVRP